MLSSGSSASTGLSHLTFTPCYGSCSHRPRLQMRPRRHTAMEHSCGSGRAGPGPAPHCAWATWSSSNPCLCLLAPHTEWEHLGRRGNICTGVFTARQSIFGLMHPFHQHFLLHWGESFLGNTALSNPEEGWSSGEINNAKWSLMESNVLLPPPHLPSPSARTWVRSA